MNGVATAVVIVLIVCAVRYNAPQYHEYQSCLIQRAELQAKNEATSEKLLDFRSKQQRFYTDKEFIIHLAHSGRRVFPGEVLFVFPGPAPESDSESK